MNRKALSGKMLMLLLSSVLSLALFITPTHASPTKVYVDPPFIFNPDMTPGTQFSVDICVDYVENLWAYQFGLVFNPEVIHGVSVENGPFLGSAGGDVSVAPGIGFNNEEGVLYLFTALIWWLWPLPPPPGICPDGGGVLATVTFEVVGYGCSNIMLIPDTKLYRSWGDVIPSYLEHGLFCNLSPEEAPELYIRRRGAHGTSGVWPEWQVGLPDWAQTLYCKVTNWGEMGAWVEVEFIVRSELGGIELYRSNQAWVDPLTKVDDETHPGEVTVTASFIPEIVGKYYVCAILYFKVGGMTEKIPYYLVQETLGGEGLSRDINVAFKVQTHL